MPEELDRERLELERKKHEDEMRLAEERLRLDARSAGRLSAGAVTLIGALVALVSVSLTALIGGHLQLAVKQREVAGQLELEEKRVDADLERLDREQQFQVLLRATQDQQPEVAAKNLEFFVDIGYLDDPTGKIKEYARERRAPTITSPPSTSPSPTTRYPCPSILAYLDAPSGVPVEKKEIDGRCEFSVDGAAGTGGVQARCQTVNAVAYAPMGYTLAVTTGTPGTLEGYACRIDVVRSVAP